MRFIILLISFLLNYSLFSQQIVNIGRTALTNTNCQITLYVSSPEVSVLSNVVFTLSWRSSRNITLGNPTTSSNISISKSGPVRTNGNKKYQTFSGIGFTPGLIGSTIVINIPRTGTGEIDIATDSYVNRKEVNGRYYVSIGGINSTGGLGAFGSRESR